MSEVLMLNGKVYSRGDVSAKSLTYAEWLALPEDIRNTGMYFITDASAIGDSVMEFNANENGMNVGYYENGTKKEIMLPANVKDFAKKDLVTDLSTEPVVGSAVDANAVFNALGNAGGITVDILLDNANGQSSVHNISISEDKLKSYALLVFSHNDTYSRYGRESIIITPQEFLSKCISSSYFTIAEGTYGTMNAYFNNGHLYYKTDNYRTLMTIYGIR